MDGLGGIRHKLDFAFDLDGNVERKLGQSDGTARVRSNAGSEHTQDQICEPVDDCGLTIESRRGVDHAEYPVPARDALQVAELALETAQDGKTGKAGGRIRLLHRDFGAHLAKRLSE